MDTTKTALREVEQKDVNTIAEGNAMTIRQRVEQSTAITPFQRRVYLELLNVPVGETITYGELARRIGCRSAQAVGQALRRNPFASDVPCHRVVSADGSLGGYFGQRNGEQIAQKQRLLAEEGCVLDSFS